MRFITVRDLRSKSAQIWSMLPKEKQIVITLNGKPIAVLSSTSENTVEETLAAMRTARAIRAVEAMQKRSAEVGTDRLTLEEINAEIDKVRKARPK